MSHLGTIINRVKTREKMGTGDALFRQGITNLKEYMLLYRDFTPEEKTEADAFLKQYPDFVDRKLVDATQRDMERQAHREAMEKLAKG